MQTDEERQRERGRSRERMARQLRGRHNENDKCIYCRKIRQKGFLLKRSRGRNEQGGRDDERV